MPAERLYVPTVRSQSTLMTADELLPARIPDKHVELVRGVLVVRQPPGLRHGRIATELGSRLVDHVRRGSLGRVYVESGFHLARDPDTVRGPDIAFISQGRVPAACLSGGRRPASRPGLPCRRTESVLSAEEALLGEDVLPGFSCPLEEIL